MEIIHNNTGVVAMPSQIDFTSTQGLNEFPCIEGGSPTKLIYQENIIFLHYTKKKKSLWIRQEKSATLFKARKNAEFCIAGALCFSNQLPLCNVQNTGL